MKKLLLLLVLLALPAYGQTAVGTMTAAGATCAVTNACIILPIASNGSSASIALTGTWAATVQFEASPDGGTTYVAINGTPPSSTSAVTSSTANGVWTFNVGSMTHLRARVSAFTSGTVSANINASPAPIMASGGGSGTSAFSSSGTGTGYQDVTEIAAPANPAAGVDRLYTNSTTHVLSCLTSGGANCLTNSGTAWNNITAATGNLTLANTTFNTTISNTASTNFIVHSNTTAATNLGVNQSSPLFNECGNYFTLGASAQDCWNMQDAITAGTKSTTVTNVAESAGNVVTLTITGGTFVAGQKATFTGLTTATWLNSQNAFLTTASATSLTFTDPTAHGTQGSAAETGQVTQANPESSLTLSHSGSGNGALQTMYQYGQATFSDGTTYPTSNIGQLTVPGRICGITNTGNYPASIPYGFAMHDICPTLFTVASPPATGTSSQSMAIVNAAFATQIPTNTNQFLFNGQIATPVGYAGNLTGSTFGFYHETDHNGTGILTNSWGGFFSTYNSGNGTITNNRALYAEAINDFYNTGTTGIISNNVAASFKSGAITGTNTNDTTLLIMTPLTGGTFSNAHVGLKIADQTNGGAMPSAYSLVIGAGNATPSGQIDLGANPIFLESTGSGFLTLNAPTGTYGSRVFRWPLYSGYLASTPCGTGKVFLSSDFTSANSAGLQLITGLTCAFPTLGSDLPQASFTCSLMYSQAINVAGDQFGVAYTGGITNFNAWGTVATNTGAATPFTTGNALAIATNTPTSVVTFQPGNTGVNVADLHGTIEASASGTFQLYITNGTAADVIVVKRDSYCQFF